MGYPDNNEKRMEDAKLNLVNILKMEGYKLDSGTLFTAFKEAGGEMSDFKGALELLTEEGKIRFDSEGNIMTVEDYQRERSQSKPNSDSEVNEIDKEDASEEIQTEDNEEKSSNDEENNENELESIIKLKEETDSWLIDKLKNNNDNEMIEEIKNLKERVQKLENIIGNLTKAFE
tara:strand:+ start:5232 stop:5756 length:525 start_codon:yes stop_codon:yes gene_type:complete